MIVKKNQRKNIIIFHLILILLFFKFISAEITCPKNKPILISGECNSTFCSKEDFESNKCKIANSIIKTQWLNNIIKFGDINYRYLSFGSFSSGDILVEATSRPKSENRLFYGLKQNGRPLFTIKPSNNESAHYTMVGLKDNGQYEMEGFVFKSSEENNKGTEYFFSFSKLSGYAEIFDFEKDKVYYKQVKEFTGIDYVKTLRHAIVPLSTTSDYNYLMGFMGDDSSLSSPPLYVYFQKHIFDSISNFKTTTTYRPSNIKKENAYGKGVSCFQATSGVIICFYLTSETTHKYFKLHKFESDLSNEVIESLNCNINSDAELMFYKCIHLKGNVGIFSSFYKYTNINPFFLFKEFKNDDFTDYLPSTYTDSKIIIDKADYYYNNLLLSDLIKITDNKVVFVSSSKNKEILYLILFNIFGENEDIRVKIRYYSLPLYDLYHHKILLDLRIEKYNKYLAFAFSYCPSQDCVDDDSEHYAAVMIFSYPNSTDTTIQLDNFLLEKNVDPRNLEIDLTKLVNIENNIFGYILSNIYIVKIEGTHHKYFPYSSKYDSMKIEQDYTMEKDEKIIFKFEGTENFFPKINKTIEYYFIATEPDYDIYENYPDELGGESDEGFFNQEQYIGRLSYYYIKSEIEFSFGSDCEGDNCKLCGRNTKTYCYVCNYKFTESSTNGKTCKEQETDEIETTVPMTEKLTEPITEKYTEPITEKATEKITEKITEQLTDQITLINGCSEQDILNNKCSDGSLTEELLNKLYTQLKNDYLKGDLKGNNTVIQTQNVVFQISTLADQKNSDNPNVSSIDLGECEQALKDENGITEDLIVFKTDIKSEDLTQTYVQYEIYNPKDLKPLNLTICKDMKISVSTPVNLDSSTSSLYDLLKDSGYDLFNESSDFYTDVCSTFTSQNGTDMTLEDRKKEIFSASANFSLCQCGC